MNISNDPVLTLSEGMALAKQDTPRKFKRWRNKFKVRPVGRNRFSRQAIMLGLNREAGNIPMPRSLSK